MVVKIIHREVLLPYRFQQNTNSTNEKHPFDAYCLRGDFVSKKRKIEPSDVLEMRVDPEKRLCPKFDSASIALFPVADREEMGVRVLDDCAEEHIM